MKATLVACLLVCTVAAVPEDTLKCKLKKTDIPKDWLDMSSPCIKSMRKQIAKELKAAMQYLAMGAHFSRDVINRSNFAKFFFEAASEKREHAIKLISYLLMRGELRSGISNLINKNIDVENVGWDSDIAALEDALKLETYVTKSIKRIIVQCETSENNNDYHLVDYLTGEFLEEQYKGQRGLAGKISILKKMKEANELLAELRKK